METKNIKIDVPEGWEIDKEKSTFENIVFKKKEEKLPTKWEDFERIGGWYVSGFASIEKLIPERPLNNKNIWPTKELAEASLALCQLIRYRDAWNKGWVPDWEDGNSNKYGICISNNRIIGTLSSYKQIILSFETSILRDKFLIEFKDLLEIAKPLL